MFSGPLSHYLAGIVGYETRDNFTRGIMYRATLINSLEILVRETTFADWKHRMINPDQQREIKRKRQNSTKERCDAERTKRGAGPAYLLDSLAILYHLVCRFRKPRARKNQSMWYENRPCSRSGSTSPRACRTFWAVQEMKLETRGAVEE